MGVPHKFQFSRILFSKNLRYGSFTYCGKFAKRQTKEPLVFGNCVQYFILMYFPFNAGGGVSAMIGSMTSFSFCRRNTRTAIYENVLCCFEYLEYALFCKR